MIRKTLILDDHRVNSEWLELLISELPDLKLVCKASTVAQALEYTRYNEIDLAFIDVELQGEQGFDFITNIDKVNFDIIFTTAHSRYALQAFEYAAADFIVKPINLKALKSALERLVSRESRAITKSMDKSEKQEKHASISDQKIALQIDNAVHFVPFNDIICCEADGFYTRFYLENRPPALLSKNLKEYEQLLPKSIFYRVHKSYIVHIDKIEKYIRSDGGYIILNNKLEITVPRKKKDEFVKIVGL